MKNILSEKRSVFQFRHRSYDFFTRTHIMGVINVTPDSFSDGGKFLDLNAAVQQGLKLTEEGADLLDIGGESTRPGSESVSVTEEIERVIPVIEKLAPKIKIPISIDTYKALVAQKALEAGAEILNDISALRFDPQMVKVAKKFDCPVILMHIKGTPRNMQENPVYTDLLSEIVEYFQERIGFAKQAGLDEAKLILDPGIGFGKTLEHNLEILRNIACFTRLNRPVLVGLSRKSFIGKILDLPVTQRLEGSLAALAFAILKGANLVRVHDVKESGRVARIIDRLKPA